MNRLTVFGCAVFAALTCSHAMAQQSQLARARMERRAVDQIRSEWAGDSVASKTAAKVECAVPNALPAGPSPQAQIVQFSGAWGLDDRFDATLWREGCPSDTTASILYFRVSQAIGTSFVCGLEVGQSNLRYDAILVQTVAHTAFCDNIAAPTTFVIDQYPDNPQFDNNGAITVTYKGAYNNIYAVSLPPFGAGSSTVLPTAGLWWNPAEPGTGYALDVKHGVLVVTVYSYTSSGSPVWYLAAGPIVNNVFTATLDKYSGGQCISCGYHTASLGGNDGLVSIAFSTPAMATMTLPGGRVFPVVPQAF